MERVVLCAKWGDVFPPTYVNRLFNAVAAHLDGTFEFVCLTNEPQGLDPEIRVFPLPDLDLPSERYVRGAWPKLSVFKRDLYGLTGRALFIDLDSAVVSNLNCFFDGSEVFRAIGAGNDWRRNKIPSHPELATGVFAFNLGEHDYVLDAFQRNPEAAFLNCANEQQFVEAHIKSWEPWPNSWIESFKRHLCQPIGLDLLRRPNAPAHSTKIVAFHGDPRPIDLINRKGLWTKPPHSVRCPIDWLDEYWIRHSAPA